MKQNKLKNIKTLKEQVKQHEYWIQLLLKSNQIKTREQIDTDTDFGKDVP